MKSSRLIPLAIALAVASSSSAGVVAAQEAGGAAQRPARVSAGWDARPDRLGAEGLSIGFPVSGEGLTVTTGPAAILWPANSTTSGPFVAEATFTQLRKPAHAEAFGLIWGGKDLKADGQQYFYLIIRGDGKYMVKHRAGAATHELVPWTDHAAVTKEGADGKAKTTLRVESSASGVKLFANGQLLRELPASATNDGIVGVRVNHNLDVAIDGFAVSKP